MKTGPAMPKDLDPVARKKWKELVDACDPDVDQELLANFCRQFATLMEIREERARQQKAGTFKTTVPGRDGTEALNPLLVHEGRLFASLNKMLKLLGMTPSTDERAGNRKSEPNPAPPGMTGPEPPCGWAIEIALCRGLPNPTPQDLKLEKQWDEWLAARKK
jgi:phage terminase small subunit